jgi:hypothetical protein
MAGIKGVCIEDPAEVESKLAEALAHPRPVLVDAVVNRMDLAMPPKVTAEMAKGFTLYMLKAVLNGRGDEMSNSPDPICGGDVHPDFARIGSSAGCSFPSGQTRPRTRRRRRWRARSRKE